ncbi:membrane hypothetical protein [Candidatus Sulfobium mesophilum]|uniref:Glycosyltransferase RgtA/B/C/D-like domain-containing protein n=1 Tax=Candidatus Sulfobium mesophilum TaxID=2016548 RepID=A0A2U3QF27_9BACT|nr:membrane hypothetical protein [Candidatus Sulfobium mesophilum]
MPLHGSKPQRSYIAASLAFLVVVTSLVSWANFSYKFDGFVLNDYHEYCEIARNFYEGNGYSTSVLRPIAYKYFDTLPHPEVTRMPVYPFFLSLFFHLFGPTDNTVVLFNSICYAALAVLIFFITYELSGNYIMSLLVALMTAFMESYISYTVTAEPNIFYAAAIAAFFYFYLKYPGKALLQGIFLGLLYMLRANTLFVFMGFLVGLVIIEGTWKKRFSVATSLVLGFALGLVPYMIRNYMVVGKPFFSLYKYSLVLFTKGFPAYTIWTQITDVDPTRYAFSHPVEMLVKSFSFFVSLLRDSISFYNPLVLILIGIGFFLPIRDRRLQVLRLIIVSGIVIQTILVLPVGPVPYYYMFFFPLMISVAVINANDYVGKKVIAVALCSLAVFMYTTIPYWKSPKPINPYIPIGRQIAEVTDRNDIILTDIPWEITWYADRKTIWLPYNLETLQKISRTLKPKYILLTGRVYAAYEGDTWNKMLFDVNYSKSFGYEFSKTVLFQNKAVGVLYKAVSQS